jgi:hypothetical protein
LHCIANRVYDDHIGQMCLQRLFPVVHVPRWLPQSVAYNDEMDLVRRGERIVCWSCDSRGGGSVLVFARVFSWWDHGVFEMRVRSLLSCTTRRNRYQLVGMVCSLLLY